MKPADYTYYTYFFYFLGVWSEWVSVLSRWELDPFLYGIIQFGPKAGLVPVIL